MLKYNSPRFLLRKSVIFRNIKPSKNFLEIGAGNLKLSSELINYFDHGTAIDFEESIKDNYRALPQTIKNNLELKVGDFAQMDIGQQFDCIVSCEVMEHLEDDRAFLENIYNLMENNGQVIISVPAKEKYWTIHDEAVGHYRRYEKNDLRTLFYEQGFKDIQIISYGFPFINMLWVLRALHGRFQYRKKRNWTAEERTKASGAKQIPKGFDLLGIVSNKYVFFFPSQISKLFEKLDWSEGYIVNATK